MTQLESGGILTAKSMESFFDASPRLADPKEIRKVRQIFPYTFFPVATIQSEKS